MGEEKDQCNDERTGNKIGAIRRFSGNVFKTHTTNATLSRKIAFWRGREPCSDYLCRSGTEDVCDQQKALVFAQYEIEKSPSEGVFQRYTPELSDTLIHARMIQILAGNARKLVENTKIVKKATIWAELIVRKAVTRPELDPVIKDSSNDLGKKEQENQA